MSLEMYNAGMTAASNAAGKLSDVFAKQAEDNTNGIFEKAWGSKSDSDAQYNSNEYERFGFENRAKAEAFIQYANENGIDVTSANVKINGQWLVEIPKKSEVSVTTDEGTMESKIVTSESFVMAYRNEKFEDVELANRYDHGSQGKKVTEVETSQLGHYIVGQMDVLGTTVSVAGSVQNKMEEYANKYGSKAVEESRHNFDQAVRTVTNEDGSKELVADMNQIRTESRMKTAMVVGDNVYINGELCTNEAVCKAAIKERDIRVKNAEKLLESIAKAEEKGKMTPELERQKANAEYAANKENAISVASKDPVLRAALTAGVIETYTTAINQIRFDKISPSELANIKGISQYCDKYVKGGDNSSKTFYDNMTSFAKSSSDLPELRKKIEEIQDRVKSGELSIEEAAKLIHKETTEETAKRLKEVQSTAKIMIAGAAISAGDLAADLQKNFGMHFPTNHFLLGKVTTKDFVEINKIIIQRSQKLDIDIIGKKGNIDFKKIKNLSEKQIKELGLDGVAGKAIKEVNQKGAWGGKNKDVVGARNALLLGLSLKAATKMLKSDDDSIKFINGTQKTVSYTRKTVKTAKQAKNAAKNAWNAHKAKSAAKKGKNGLSGKSGKSKTASNPAKKTRGYNQNKANRALKKQNKRLKKLTKKQNGAFAKLRKKADKVLSKIVNNPLSKAVSKLKAKILGWLMPIIGKILLVIILIWAIMMIICLVISIILSFLNLFGDLLAPKTYKDTLAYQIVEKVEEHRDNWEDYEVQDFQLVWDNKDWLGWGGARYTIDSYVNVAGSTFTKTPGLSYENNKLYTTPFPSLVKPDLNSEYRTEITGWNGECSFKYSANANIYGLKTMARDGAGNIIRLHSTQSGHTDNTKDILAMTELLYFSEGEDGNASDQFMADLGMSKAELWWENTKGFFKSAWHNFTECCKSFWSWLTGDEGEEQYVPKFVKFNGLDYATLETYAVNLFHQSHQTAYYMQTAYHDKIDELKINLDGTVKDYTKAMTKTASALGICKSPVEHSFPIATRGVYVAPYLMSSFGSKSFLNQEGVGEITIDMVENYADNDACLKFNPSDGTVVMNSDKATVDFIKGNKAGCWTVEQVEGVKTYSDQLVGKVVSNWFETEEQALSDAETKLLNKWNGYVVETDDKYNYTVDTLFKHEYNKKYDYRPNNEEVTITNTRVVQKLAPYYYQDTHLDAKPEELSGVKMSADKKYQANGQVYAYYIVKNTVGLTKVEDTNRYNGVYYGTGKFEYTDANGDGIQESGEYKNYFNYENNLGLYNAAQKLVETDRAEFICNWSPKFGELAVESYVTEEQKTAMGKYGYFVLEVPMETFVDVTEYQIDIKAPFRVRVTDNYTRVCKKHTFKYCGGHLGLQTEGIVYSITNEQAAAGGAFDYETQVPVVEGFDMTKAGYLPLMGKVILKEVQYLPNAGQASVTGGCPPAAVHIQGSDIANRGLNLNATGDQWHDNNRLREIENKFAVRDIFDCDCISDKGDNIFPIVGEDSYKQYTGWDADAMTKVGLKTTGDWFDVYEFDIEYERDGATLTKDHITKIVEEITKQYGAEFTKERRLVVETALQSVGRFHYSDDHNHGLLNEICDTMNWDGMVDHSANCTAGDTRDFIEYVLQKSKVLDNADDYLGETDNFVYAKKLNRKLLPGDILRHTEEVLTVDDITDYTDLKLTTAQLNSLKQTKEKAMFKAYAEPHWVIYLGRVNKDITIYSDHYEMTIKAGQVLTVDLTDYEFAGTVKLRFQTPSFYGDITNEKHAYWALQACNAIDKGIGSPDDRTYVYNKIYNK